MKRIKRYLCVLLIVCFGIGCLDTRVSAAGEHVYFGSEQYEWSIGQEAPIGVYAGADEGVNRVEMEVRYDPERLEYISGGELIQPGIIRIGTDETAVQEYQEMLHFTPEVSGNTEITIQNAVIENSSGETQITEAVKAPVWIPFAAGCELTELSVNGQSVAGFEPSATEYNVDIDGEEANVQAAASDPQTTIDITQNDSLIQIRTTNVEGNQGLYTIHVTRKQAPVTEEPQEQNIQNDQQVQPQEQNIQNDQQVQPQEQNIQNDQQVQPQDITQPSIQEKVLEKLLPYKKLLVLLAAAVLLLVILLVGLAVMKRKRKKRALQRKEKKIQDKNQKFHEIELQDTAIDLTGVEENLPVTDERELEIQVKHVSMEFSKEKDESTSLKELLVKTLKGQRKIEKFKALDDVSFNVKKGEVVGIIGTNGSGKSTILKIISGVLKPTEGKVIVDKDKIQLLTLGTGFDYELTGRENVYLNGAVIGYTKEFIDEKYDEIVKFAELEGFMEQKVRNYSSGMVSRLGFAIATVRDTPEILILDEVLSVGDMFFRKKSERRIKEMMRSGSTVLIVSHSTSVIKANCTKAVWIEKGKLMAVGRPDDVCRAYEKMNG